MQDPAESARENLEDERFWQDVHRAYRELADNPAQLAALHSEISAWDETLHDGLPA